jgi:hypothetical protein
MPGFDLRQAQLMRLGVVAWSMPSALPYHTADIPDYHTERGLIMMH